MGFAEWICLGCLMLQEFKRKKCLTTFFGFVEVFFLTSSHVLSSNFHLNIYETVTSNTLPKMKIS